ncbi:4'-phosphopantetheinyl transferase family protein [Kitasatospora acidiphila]|uniref:4'-phosphopantetheinyl transferase family protein n=1 Tax=Kitasatospora acidiphila TaxID=2567942 RepID=UPI003C72AFC2
MLGEILPPGTAAAEFFGDIPEVRLLPAEERALGNALPHRRSEFGTARAAARRALTRLGLPPLAVPADPRGVPQWPDGVTGSITHCADYRACAVARTTDVRVLGIDAEPDRPLSAAVVRTIAVPAERTHLVDLEWSGGAQVAWDRLLFSAKEAAFKAVFPQTRIELDFPDVEIAINPAAGTFTARLPSVVRRAQGGLPALLPGRWLARSGLLVTAVALPTNQPGGVDG